jgi:hypothetical protein
MAIKIPPDAKIVQDQRLTVIRAVATLNDRLCKGKGGLIAKVKSAMEAKNVEYAESDFVVAELRGDGEDAGKIDVDKAFKLCGENGIKLKDFLACCTVRKGDLKKLVSENEVEKITTYGTAEKKLVTEFRSAIDAVMDPEVLYRAIGRGITGHLKALSTARA